MSILINSWSKEERDAARPPEKMTVTEWAVAKRELGRGSAITGRYPIELVPFFRMPMDMCASSDYDDITIVKPAQFGGTVAFLENVVGYYVEQEPSPVMVVLADEDTAKFVSVEKIAPMFRESSKLSHLYEKRAFGNFEINPPNGSRVDFVWASSVAKLASRPKRIVIADETDKPGYTVASKEASAVSLLKERTKSYPTGFFKHIFLSTPTIETGNILTLMNASELIYDWHCPCPRCGTFQPLRWTPEYTYGFQDGEFRTLEGGKLPFGKVVWEGGSEATRAQIRATAGYKCGVCGEVWSSVEKNKAVLAGRHVPRTEPVGDERKIAFHFNRLLSLMDSGKLEHLIFEWVGIFKRPKDLVAKELQGFVNSALAEPFSNVRRVHNTKITSIMKAKAGVAAQVVPEQAVALVAFVDPQKYEFWFTVRAYARDFRSWLVHYGRLSTWEDVETLFFETSYPHEGHASYMRVWRAGIDTGGSESRYENASMTEVTYHWLRKVSRGRGCRVWGTKGVQGLNGAESIRVGKRLDKTPAGKPLDGGLQLILLDTFQLKTAFHARMAAAMEQDDTARPAYLNADVGEDYARQILAEELVVDGKGVESWVNVQHKPNHYFDCEIGCLALAEPEWPGGGVNLIRSLSSASEPTGRRIISKGIDI